MVVKLDKRFDSEFEVYYTLISMYNVIEKWGLTETQIKILIYLIRFGYSKETKEIICEKLNISDSSLTTNLSYLRQGRIGKKKIKKLLETSQNNMNITLLKTELNDIKMFIESKDNFKAFYIKFEEDDNTQKITASDGKKSTGRSSKRTGV